MQGTPFYYFAFICRFSYAEGRAGRRACVMT